MRTMTSEVPVAVRRCLIVANRTLAGDHLMAEVLARHDAYHFFARTGDLLKTGLTGTNVMDVTVILVV